MRARARDDLPPGLVASISKLGRVLAYGKILALILIKIRPRLLNNVLNQLGALRPEAVGTASGHLSGFARLYSYRDPFGATDRQLLKMERRLAWVFLFHGNGFVREAALESLTEPPNTPFFFAAIVWRLNDWAYEVRAAGLRAAQRLFPATPAEVIVGASSFLVGRTFYWGRWHKDDEAIVDRLLDRADVVALLARRFEFETAGPLGAQLKYALRRPGLDPYLRALSCDAKHPGVRAVALEALLRERVSWQSGFKKEWIDRRYGLFRQVLAHAERPLTEQLPSHPLIMQGLADKSALVRRVAVDAVIARRTTFPGLADVIEKLSRDKSRRLRERAEFLKRKLAEESQRAGQ